MARIIATAAITGAPNAIYLGFTDDAILRTQGIKLVDGRMPGFAACVGAMPTTEEAVRLARELQERNILVFLASHTGGGSMAAQLAEGGGGKGWGTPPGALGEGSPAG